MAADMEQIKLFLVTNNMENKIDLFVKLTTETFDDVRDVKSAENPILDNYYDGSGSASPGECLHSNNVLNKHNCSMDLQDLINTCIFEQFQELLFSDVSGPLRIWLL